MAENDSAIKALFAATSTQKRRKAAVKNATKSRKGASKSNESDRLTQIFYVAARLFCERGFDGTTMSDIADAIGVTKAAVYHFMPGNKQDLLFAVMSYGMDTLDRTVIEPAQAIPDAEQRLRAIITNHVKLVALGSTSEGYNPVTVVVDEVGGLSATQRRKLDQRKRAYLELIRTTLNKLQQEGKLNDINVTVIAFGMIGMIMWLARWYRPEGKLTSDQIAEDISKTILGGILLPRKRASRG